MNVGDRGRRVDWIGRGLLYAGAQTLMVKPVGGP